ncbi:coiled-coil domain-containing protein 154-like [Branchiostoma lanceolatum]|uniref:coiled-coil domain-containing protein 154-like n=1 Tax=Branchiostoma lanceolatum TaxID=7740 RepID=UPI003452ADFA
MSMWNEQRAPPFHTRVGILPGIGSDSPQPTSQNQVVPVTRGKHLSPVIDPGYGESSSMGSSGKGVDSRITIVEQSNRALLEEVVRLQGELKASNRRQDQIISEERKARQQVIDNLRSSNDLISQLATRLKRAEDSVVEEREAVSALVGHTKQVEKAVISSQQELVGRRDTQSTRITELRHDLDQSKHAREQLERATMSLIDEVRQMKAKLDGQGADLKQVADEVKQRSRRLEEDSRQAIDTIRKQSEMQQHTEVSSSQLRMQFDGRLGEVRDVVLELRNRQSQEEMSRRQLEQQMESRIAEMQSTLSNLEQKREGDLHTVDILQREREQAAENERVRLQGKLSEIAEEVSKKILQKEIRLREEAQQKFHNVEKVLRGEEAARIGHERTIREDNEKRWSALQQMNEQEFLALRDIVKVHKSKTAENFQTLSESVSVLEKQAVEAKRQLEKVLKAEIQTRQSQDQALSNRVDDLQEKLGVAVSTLQQAVGGVRTQMADVHAKTLQDMRNIMDESRQSNTRGLADLDARIMGLNARVSHQEEAFEAKLGEIQSLQTDNLRKNMDSLTQWQALTQQQMKDIQEMLEKLPTEVSYIKEQQRVMKSEVETRLDTEMQARIRDIQNVREDITRILEDLNVSKGGDEAKLNAVQSQLTQGLAQVKNLEQMLQTSKTVMSTRVSSEAKSRIEEVQALREELIRLRADVINLKNREPAVPSEPPPPPDPRLPFFIRSPEDNFTSRATLNKWGIYQAYRWWKIKRCWLQVLEKEHSPTPQPKSPTPKPPHTPKRDDQPQQRGHTPNGRTPTPQRIAKKRSPTPRKDDEGSDGDEWGGTADIDPFPLK